LPDHNPKGIDRAFVLPAVIPLCGVWHKNSDIMRNQLPAFWSLNRGRPPKLTSAKAGYPGCFHGRLSPRHGFRYDHVLQRHTYAEIVPNQRTATWLACHRRAFEFFGGVPLKIIIDNAKCAITRACYYDPEVQRSYGEMAKATGLSSRRARPRSPEKRPGRIRGQIRQKQLCSTAQLPISYQCQ